MSRAANDALILDLIRAGIIRVDAARGKVYSLRSQRPRRALRGTPNYRGYVRICINLPPEEDGGRRRKLFFFAHRVVWVSVHGPLADGFEVEHKFRRKTDNRICQLEAVPAEVNRVSWRAVPAPPTTRRRPKKILRILVDA